MVWSNGKKGKSSIGSTSTSTSTANRRSPSQPWNFTYQKYPPASYYTRAYFRKIKCSAITRFVEKCLFRKRTCKRVVISSTNRIFIFSQQINTVRQVFWNWQKLSLLLQVVYGLGKKSFMWTFALSWLSPTVFAYVCILMDPIPLSPVSAKVIIECPPYPPSHKVIAGIKTTLVKFVPLCTYNLWGFIFL